MLVFRDGFFDMGAAACWLFRLQRLGASLAIFISTMFFPFKEANGVVAKRCQKQYGNPFGSCASASAISVV